MESTRSEPDPTRSNVSLAQRAYRIRRNALRMVEETGVTYPTFADPDGSGISFFGGTLMPTTVFIDAAG